MKNTFVYFFQSLINNLSCEYSCPSCGGLDTKLIYRKMLVTSLYECSGCGLRFRVPKDNPLKAAEFYQSDYDAGFTTALPTDEQLKDFIDRGFRGGEKDFSSYIQVLYAIGFKDGDRVLDFGSSWGYGSWQLKQAGFDVYSCEVSAIRSNYAKSKLACQMIEDYPYIRKTIKCVFSSHVLEHLPDPNIFWKFSRQVLAPDGWIVCFVPNGDPAFEKLIGKKRYHQLWGQVHPLLLTKKALTSMAQHYGFTPYVFSYPSSLDAIRNFDEGDISQKELLLVARSDG